MLVWELSELPRVGHEARLSLEESIGSWAMGARGLGRVLLTPARQESPVHEEMILANFNCCVAASHL